MFRQAARALAGGRSVILDASWTSGARRQEALGLAAATQSRLLQWRCVATRATAEARLARRLARGEDASDADATIARAMAQAADAWPEATVVDTEGPRRRRWPPPWA